jgi:hypothetical protein
MQTSFVNQFVKAKFQNQKQSRDDYNAMIIVEKTHKRVFRNIPRSKIPGDSFLQKYGNKWIHVLGLDIKNQFWAIDKDDVIGNKDIKPADVFMAKNCAEEVREVYGLSMPMMQKIKIGILIGLSFGILIVLFLIVTAASGGSAA